MTMSNPLPNPLVAERQDSTTAISGIGIVESATDVYNGISSGSWIEGGLGLVGGGLETLSLVLDPVGTLASYGVAWLMEHVKPLSDALDWLAGDADAIASYAQTWRNVAQAVGQARTDLDSAVRTDTATWTGEAGDAYRAHVAHQSEQFGAASTAAETVGTVVELVGVLVGAVREIVRDLVADCVATLIARIPQWLAEIAATLGLATPHVVASAVALISKWVARISDVIRKLVRSIEKLRPLLRQLGEIWNAIRSGARGLGDVARRDSNGFGPGSTSGATPGTASPSPTVSPDGPVGTTAQSGTPGSVLDPPASPNTAAGTSPGSAPGTTPGGVSPTVTPGTSPGMSPGTSPGTAPDTTPDGVGPNTSPAPGAPTRMSHDDFSALPTDEQMRVAQSEVDQNTRTFADNAEAQRYGSDYWNDYADNLPPDQRRALYDYTTNPPHYPSYEEINGYLREQNPGSPQVQATINRIDQALAGRPVPEDVVISRGTGLGHIGMSPQDMVGQTFTERAYVSTSLGDPAAAFENKEAVLHMRVPAGTPAIWVENVGHYGAGERELLLGRGLEYRVDRVVFDGSQWHLYGEYLRVN
jgi:ADP-ribosyltransferase exoenzyme